MTRLSIDIDLTYIPVENRSVSLANIHKALESVRLNIERVIRHAHVNLRKDIGKLQISVKGVDIKLEVNLVNRGTLDRPVKMTLCEKAQKEYDAFCAIQIVPLGQLYGGKICAALDRQHPRDLFDIKYLLNSEGFSEQVKENFIFCLLSSARPINELIMPHFKDQRSAMINQFTGMTNEPFSYEEYEEIRLTLLKTIHKNLTSKDKEFLLSIQKLAPDWSSYDFKDFPAIVWKLQNLQKLKDFNPSKYAEQFELLKKELDRL